MRWERYIQNGIFGTSIRTPHCYIRFLSSHLHDLTPLPPASAAANEVVRTVRILIGSEDWTVRTALPAYYYVVSRWVGRILAVGLVG